MNIKRLVNKMTRAVGTSSTRGRRGSDASSVGSTGQQSTGSSTHPDASEPHNSIDKIEHTLKAPIEADNPHLTARIKAMQSKQMAAMAQAPHLKILQKRHKGPEHISDSLLAELGIMPDKQSSKLIVRCLKDIEFVDRENNLVMHPSIAPNIMPAVKDMMAQAGQPLTATQEKGILTLMNSMAENLKTLGQDISRLPPGQRPHWAFYAELVITPAESERLMHRLRDAGVISYEMLPRNGGAHFDAFSQSMKSFWHNTDPDMGEIADRQLAALHEALFPLPVYEAKAKNPINLPKYEDTVAGLSSPVKYKP